ncbi:4'-phosphopantetheinyl transferase [Streptomyces sp. NBC_00059]|uniref:4'-phosphopantetheinyl transferase family protein n=1 Tax=Streptomyces sp. NBC_00059 TaxID=2975635 RepID=UPI0022570316|nr:4'-phosphopantetheinyl transferase superfamily protein [Streptomyces sp. NBC_00059]MCX5415068.1 4'-phosphopantetheinyl transferase superfamily protein [Streptomyces sp. NBC_00059]
MPERALPEGPAAPAGVPSPGLFDGLLPDGAYAAECFGDPGGLRPYPEEEDRLGEAVVDRRRREFTTARWCARRALAAVGAPTADAPLRRGRRGEPLWPAGFTGSITHSAGYRAAVAAPSGGLGAPGSEGRDAPAYDAPMYDALGIDAERAVALSPAVAAAIASDEEAAHLAALPPVEGLPWDTLLFSVKEAVYKAWFPRARVRLTFRSARIVLVPDRDGGSTGSLTAEPAGPARGARPAPPVLYGRYRAASGLLVCVVHSRPSA